jgi:tryptophan-rich sensory protein
MGMPMNFIASRGQLRASLLRWSLLLVPGVMLLGFLSGQIGGDASDPWFQNLTKPSINPPSIVFPIVWTLLYAAMGFAFAMICSAWGARGRGAAIIAFLLQLAANLAWSPTFFGAHEITAALIILVVLDVLVVITIVLFWKVRRKAAYLMLPYLAWIAFATVLNWQFLELNPDADGEQGSGAVQRMEL